MRLNWPCWTPTQYFKVSGKKFSVPKFCFELLPSRLIFGQLQLFSLGPVWASVNCRVPFILVFITLSNSLQMLFDKDIPFLFDKIYLFFLPLSIFISIDLSHDCGICSWLKISLKKISQFFRKFVASIFYKFIF